MRILKKLECAGFGVGFTLILSFFSLSSPKWWFTFLISKSQATKPGKCEMLQISLYLVNIGVLTLLVHLLLALMLLWYCLRDCRTVPEALLAS